VQLVDDRVEHLACEHLVVADELAREIFGRRHAQRIRRVTLLSH
jgi:hypothetical protein